LHTNSHTPSIGTALAEPFRTCGSTQNYCDMNEPFPFDLFLSYSSKDRSVVKLLAERLRKDGLNVWFDEWVLKSGDNILLKLEEGLEQSRVLVLCMSANAFESDWAQM
jgi:hypothetical protein